jgi:rsbT co-antagonist protein RsbR
MIIRTMTTKVALAVLACLVPLAIAAAVTITSILVLRNSASHLAETTTTQTKLVGQFKVATTRVIGEAKVFALGDDEGEFEEAQEALAEAKTALDALDPANVRFDQFNRELAVEYIHLHEQRRASFETIEQLIGGLRTADIEQREHTVIALEDLEADLDQLEEEVDAILVEETTTVVETVTSRLQASLTSIGVVLGLSLLLPIGALLLLRRYIIQPIQNLSAATTSITNGHLDQVVRVTNNDEIGTLQRNFNTMTATIGQQTRHLEQQIDAANCARTEAETARAGLAAQLATIEEQRTVIREMSVPILPLTETTMVMPLVGALDSGRLQLVQEQALQAIERAPTQYLILDITGIPVVDRQVAHGFIQVVQMAKLLGTEVMLVGIRPEVAQALVGLGIRLDHIITRSTLQSGIAYTLQR